MTSVRTLLDRTLSRLALVGADPSDDEDTRLRKGFFVLIVVLILPISLAWCALYVTFGGPVGYTALIYFAVSVASIVGRRDAVSGRADPLSASGGTP